MDLHERSKHNMFFQSFFGSLPFFIFQTLLKNKVDYQLEDVFLNEVLDTYFSLWVVGKIFYVNIGGVQNSVKQVSKCIQKRLKLNLNLTHGRHQNWKASSRPWYRIRNNSQNHCSETGHVKRDAQPSNSFWLTITSLGTKPM